MCPGLPAPEISPGMYMLVYREKQVDKWEGPFCVVRCSRQQVWLNDDERAKMFSIELVKEYNAPLVPVEDSALDQPIASVADHSSCDSA